MVDDQGVYDIVRYVSGDLRLHARFPKITLDYVLGGSVRHYMDTGQLKAFSAPVSICTQMRRCNKIIEETQDDGIVTIRPWDYSGTIQFVLTADQNSKPNWMKCGGDECLCESDDDQECTACCMAEGCAMCDGPLESIQWIDYVDARDLLADIAGWEPLTWWERYEAMSRPYKLGHWYERSSLSDGLRRSVETANRQFGEVNDNNREAWSKIVVIGMGYRPNYRERIGI